MGEAAAVASSAVWAVASLLFMGLGRDLDARVLNLLKTLLATVGLWLTLWLVQGHLWPTDLSHAELGWLALSGLIGLTIGDTAYFRALVRIGPRRALLLWALTPPVTAILAVPILNEPVTPALLLGMALTLGGVVWVVMERQAGGRPQDWGGVALGLLAMLCQASGNILTKLGGSHSTALEITVVRLAVGTAALVVVVGWSGKLGDVMKVRDRGIAGRLALATFLGTYLGIWLSMAGLRYAPAAVAATLGSLSPVFILPLAKVFLDEHISLRATLGATLAVAGVAVLFLR